MTRPTAQMHHERMANARTIIGAEVLVLEAGIGGLGVKMTRSTSGRSVGMAFELVMCGRGGVVGRDGCCPRRGAVRPG